VSEPCTNVLLITIDCLRADAVGALGGQQPTPSMDRLAGEALVFEQAVATGPDTSNSFAGILASNYPTTGGSVQNLGGRPSVAECFSAAGFRTAAFHSNPFLSAARSYGRGFHVFSDSLPSAEGVGAKPEGDLWLRVPPVAARLGAHVARRCPWLFRLLRRAYRRAFLRSPHLRLPHEPAETINRRAMQWLDGGGEPFFLWLHYMDPHWPYATGLPGLSEEERAEARRLCDRALRQPGRLGGAEVVRLRELYAEEVQHLDRCLGELFDFMAQKELWQQTAVFLTADHGEAFTEHGSVVHGDLLYDELLRVPLMVKAPGISPARRGGVASLIDLAPTLCEVAGLEPPETFEGRSLLTGARAAAVAETAYRLLVSDRPRRVAVRTPEWKLIVDCEAGTDALYHLATDPEEQHDVAAERPQEAARLRALAEQHLARPRPRASERRRADEPRADDEVVKARLRALGYLDEADGPATKE